MKSKDLRVCIDHLRSLQTRDDTDPRQREVLDQAIAKLKQLARKPSPSRAEVFRTVREVTEGLLRVCLKDR